MGNLGTPSRYNCAPKMIDTIPRADEEAVQHDDPKPYERGSM